MEFSYEMWSISILPIAVFIIAMSFLKIKTKNSAMISLGVALFSGIFLFKLEVVQILISLAKGASLSLYVILIIFGAVLLYNVVKRAGGFVVIEKFSAGLGGSRLMTLLGFSWAFSGFIQGLTGFGVPVAIVGGLLVAMGFNPLIALCSVLIGHSWSISFGSMGTSFFALNMVTGLDTVQLGITMAKLFFIPIFTTGAAVAFLFEGFRGVKKSVIYILPISLLMGSFQYLAARYGFPHLGGLLAGLSGSIVFFAFFYKNRDKTENNSEKEKLSINQALFPYFLLIFLVLFFQLPFVRDNLPSWGIRFSFPAFTTGLGYEVEAAYSFGAINFFSHPFMFLVIASIAGFILFSRKALVDSQTAVKVLRGSLKQASSSSMSVLFLMMMALVMNDSGMIFIFAQGMANISGNFFPVMSPLIGIFGAFLTGSNTSSNVLFGAFQTGVANELGMSSYLIASAQSVGGSLGSAIAPAKILMGISVVKMDSGEDIILKKCLVYTLISGFLVGIVSFVVSLL